MDDEMDNYGFMSLCERSTGNANLAVAKAVTMARGIIEGKSVIKLSLGQRMLLRQLAEDVIGDFKRSRSPRSEFFPPRELVARFVGSHSHYGLNAKEAHDYAYTGSKLASLVRSRHHD
jgi:hypothetical protein